MEALERLGPDDLRRAVTAYRDALRAHQDRLNRLNVYPVPDGDTGTNMALTVESVLAEVESGGSDLAGVCKAIGHGSLMGARGNSGVILSQVLRGMCARLVEAGEAGIDGDLLASALASASEAAYQAVMNPVEGTILTVVRESAEAAAGRRRAPLLEVLETAAEAARVAVERTPDQLPVLAEAGVVDAGGSGFVLLLDALLHVVDGRALPEAPAVPVAARVAAPEGSRAADEPRDTSGPRYEVMYLLEAPDDRIDGFKSAWSALGDSIVVVGGDGLWNCHVHTDAIGESIEAGIEVGRPRRIRVTDLCEQVEEERWVREGRRVVTGVVAVGAGAGLAQVLRSLGASEVVAGGQCMNPSTAEILAAVEAVPADQVVVLPNNKNVIPAARQAVEAASKPVSVVPTRTIVEGLAALLAYDAGNEAEANAKSMQEAAANVVSGEVTRAVRDARSPVGDIAEGDHLGIAGDDVVVVRAELAVACCALLDRLVDDGHELVTVVEGTGATGEGTEAIRAWLGQNRPGVAVEVQDWGHPLSSYLFSIE